MKDFFQYIKYKRNFIILCCLFAVITVCVFILFRLPLDAVWYPIILCFSLGIFFLLFDFVSAMKKHKRIIELTYSDPRLVEIVEKADSFAEADYIALIDHLREELKSQAEASEEKYTSMIEYYTLWAHQIKTPIASMRINLQNEDSAFSRKLQNDLCRIEQYVEMVLTYLRLDADTTDYLLRECKLDEILSSSIKKFRGDFIGKKISLHFEPTEAVVLTDEKWFAFVVEQILSNALKYTNEGSITIEYEPKGILRIKDTGIGIAPEDLPRIFDNGFTGFNGRTDKKASGIGLYLCKRVCDNLGHKISVESEVGVGTAFSIDLSSDDSFIE